MIIVAGYVKTQTPLRSSRTRRGRRYDYERRSRPAFQSVQIAGIIAMRDSDAHVVEQGRIYQKRRDVLVAGLRRLGWEVESPKATMFVWAKIKAEHLARHETSSAKLCMAMVDEADVAMTPGAAFGEGGEGYVRIALVENEQRIRQALRQLDRALNRGRSS